MNIATFDIDLLKLPDALLRQGSTARAAEMREALARVGRSRRVVMTVPSFRGVSAVVAKSDGSHFSRPSSPRRWRRSWGSTCTVRRCGWTRRR
jgi:hypothetical protein